MDLLGVLVSFSEVLLKVGVGKVCVFSKTGRK